jgi:hypothetical protein
MTVFEIVLIVGVFNSRLTCALEGLQLLPKGREQ